MAVIFWTSGTALKMRQNPALEIIAYAQGHCWKLLRVSGSLLHPQVEVKVCRVSETHKQDPDAPLSSLLLRSYYVTEVKWKTVLWSDKAKCKILFKIHGSSNRRRKETIWFEMNSQHLWWYDGISAQSLGTLHIYKDTDNVVEYKQVSELNVLRSSWTTHACSPHLSPTENTRFIMKRRLDFKKRGSELLKCCPSGLQMHLLYSIKFPFLRPSLRSLNKFCVFQYKLNTGPDQMILPVHIVKILH